MPNYPGINQFQKTQSTPAFSSESSDWSYFPNSIFHYQSVPSPIFESPIYSRIPKMFYLTIILDTDASSFQFKGYFIIYLKGFLCSVVYSILQEYDATFILFRSMFFDLVPLMKQTTKTTRHSSLGLRER